MRPYEKLIAKRQLAGVMIAHVVYAETDPLPASFSPYWINQQLRAALGFDGAVLCDDLSMKATESMGSMPSLAGLLQSTVPGPPGAAPCNRAGEA
jgi:beta-N-acetylhexosaminidase